MKILTKTLSISVVLGLFIAGSANAAVSNFLMPYVETYQTGSTITPVDPAPHLNPDADYAYVLEGAVPGAVDEVQLQLAFDAAAGSGDADELIGYVVEDFISSEGFGGEGIADEFSDIATVTDLGGGWYNITLLGGALYEGFMMKSGSSTFVALFFDGFNSLDFETFEQNAISHIALFNTTISEVPVPAALWLFGPALLGFVGLRRKAKTTIV